MSALDNRLQNSVIAILSKYILNSVLHCCFHLNVRNEFALTVHCVYCYEQTESGTTIPQHNSAYERSYYITHFSTLPTPLNTGRTYSRMRLSSALRPRTIRPCTAHDTQYCCLMYSLGRVYSTCHFCNAKRTLINRSVANISLGRSIHDVSDLETLHGLILCA